MATVPCENCYNGCGGSLMTDKCVKYTGPSVPELDIVNGEPIANVLVKLITDTIKEAVVGTAIKPQVDNEALCELILNYLPPCVNCTGFNLNELLQAMAMAICDLQGQVNSVNARVDVIEAPYVLNPCLIGVTETSGTHEILQAVMNKLCLLAQDLEDFMITVDSTFVKVADINTYIQNYISTSPDVDPGLIRNKMVPYAATLYFPPGGTLANFNSSGAGQGAWDQIYLCNGMNGTPDLRGRAPVGAITMGGTAPLDAEVNPSTAGNPNYAMGSKTGTNKAVLTDVNQIPLHGHAPTVTVNDLGHQHNVKVYNRDTINGGSGTDGYIVRFDGGYETITSKDVTGITVNVALAQTGGSPVQGHANIQPVLGAYYIMYIPA